MEKALRLSLVDAAMGRTLCDLALKNARVLNVFTKELLKADVYIKDGFIADVSYDKKSVCKYKDELDLKGLILAPGLIDTHLHIESSMLSPKNFIKAVLPHGTTTLVVDSHELANVLGIKGVEYVLKESENLPINCYALAPSCVPSLKGLENSGACFEEKELSSLLKNERVLGLGEVMDYIGVINNSKRMQEVLACAKDSFLQGHFPQGSASELSAYICAGPSSCHESSTKEEVLEKLRKGMYVDAREGSLCKNVKEVVSALKDKKNPPFNLTFCTDDKEASDILHHGHVNESVQVAIDAGLDPIAALCCASINAAREYSFKHLGAIAPSFQADFIVLEDLFKIRPKMVFVKGVLQAKDGKLCGNFKEHKEKEVYPNSIFIKPLHEKDFLINCKGKKALVNVMSFKSKTSLLTQQKQLEVEVKNEALCIDKMPDLNFLAVINRYERNDNFAKALVSNFTLKKGAFASSVAHDCHNVSVVYKDTKSALLATNELKRLKGGFVLACEGKIQASIALPIAGLLSTLEAKELSLEIDEFNSCLRKDFGVDLPSPLMRIYFLALAVIPFLKMSDMGLIDVIKQEFVPNIIKSYD